MRKNLNFDRFCSFAPPGISIRPLTSSHRSTKKILVRRSVRRYVPTSKNLGFDLEKSSGWHLNSTNRFRATRIAYGEHVVLHFPYRIIRSCLFEIFSRCVTSTRVVEVGKQTIIPSRSTKNSEKIGKICQQILLTQLSFLQV